MTRAAFVIPGDLGLPTGGYAYDRRVLALLPGFGVEAVHVALPAVFPAPAPADGDLGWGFGFQVVKEPMGVTQMLGKGTFGHGGAYATQSWGEHCSVVHRPHSNGMD